MAHRATGTPRDTRRWLRLAWRGQLSAALIGLGAGMGIDLLSTDLGYPGLAAAVAAVAVLAGTGWLRQLPPRAPLARRTSRLLLGLALAAVVVAAAAPDPWDGYSVLAAASLTLIAVLLAADLSTVAPLLGGAAGIGVGVAAIGGGIAALRAARVWLGWR